jgi:hypothetical protein
METLEGDKPWAAVLRLGAAALDTLVIGPAALDRAQFDAATFRTRSGPSRRFEREARLAEWFVDFGRDVRDSLL